jgi:hypothetical protein
MRQRNVNDVKEERHATESLQHVGDAAAHALEARDERDRGPERHQQVEQ